MNYFLQPFVDWCVSLEGEGLTCQLRGTPTNVHLYSLLCIWNCPARCQVQNIKQFNGDHGCNWCYHKGEVVEKGNGFSRVYPLESEPEPRTDTKHHGEVALVVESGNIIHGVKDASSLMLQGLLLMTCTTSYLVQISPFESWYIGREIERTKKRLLATKHPVNMTRPIKLLKYWKATEFPTLPAVL